jgi:hypothetical protein
MEKNMQINKRTKFKRQSKKGYEIYFDQVSQRIVLDIQDTDGMFPMLIKTPIPHPLSGLRPENVSQLRMG